MDFAQKDNELCFAERVGRAGGVYLTASILWLTRRWKLVLLGYASILLIGTVLVHTRPAAAAAAEEEEEDHLALVARTWGGFDERPLTNKCYRQERTATLLALFLGVLGVDQFYAQHWPLAAFKLLTLGGLGTWWLVDLVLWIVGGVYGTLGCPGGSSTEWRY